VSFLFFLLSGLGSTLLDLLLFSGLILLLDKNLSYITSYSLCICCRYLFDSRVTFAAQTKRVEGSRFLHYFAGNLMVMVFGLGVYNLLLLLPLAPDSALTLSAAGFSRTLPPLQAAAVFAKILSIPPVTLSGYFLMKQVVFKNR
jgi:putative flippase GtrA